MNFVDTADVYGDGHSERLVARFRRERAEPIIVATKAGRRLPAARRGGLQSRQNLTAFVERSLRNLDSDAIDLLQLHCPPSRRCTRCPRCSACSTTSSQAGKLRHYGVSVERVDDAIRATDYPNVQSVQIIFNMFRLKPAERFFPIARASESECSRECRSRAVCSPAKLRSDSQFAATDHRELQPERRIVRRRRDVQRRGLRRQASARSTSCAISFRPAQRWRRARAALDLDVSRRDDRNSGSAKPAAGREQCALGRSGAALAATMIGCAMSTIAFPGRSMIAGNSCHPDGCEATGGPACSPVSGSPTGIGLLNF